MANKARKKEANIHKTEATTPPSRPGPI